MSKSRSYFGGNVHRDVLLKNLRASGTEGWAGWVAGRIIGAFDDVLVLQDESARVDIVLNQELQQSFNEGQFRVGDIAKIRVQTRKILNTQGDEELQYNAEEILLLTPCTTEFFIRSTDANYRRMVVDQSLKEKLYLRARVLEGIRKFFRQQEFLEVETPTMVRLPGMEPYLDVFATEFHDLEGTKEQRFLITSPEYALKKLLVGGCEKIFELTKGFRNKETNSTRHNPEFTILEWYRAYANYEKIMQDMEELFAFVACELFGEPKLQYQGKIIDLTPPWSRKKIVELFEEMAGITPAIMEDMESLRSIVASKGYKVTDTMPFDDLFFMVFMNEIEPQLGMDKPVFIHEYPASMAALSRKCQNNPKYAERFEAYITGLELCNGFSELTDPVEQKARLEQERLERQHLGKLDYPVDNSFIEALELGMPPSAGTALGVDRMVMLFANTDNIGDVLSFPWKDL